MLFLLLSACANEFRCLSINGASEILASSKRPFGGAADFHMACLLANKPEDVAQIEICWARGDLQGVWRVLKYGARLHCPGLPL